MDSASSDVAAVMGQIKWTFAPMGRGSFYDLLCLRRMILCRFRDVELSGLGLGVGFFSVICPIAFM
jgi:hypothetical protein